VIALSAHEDTDTVLRMLRAGALGYVVKTDSTDEILWAIHRSIEGHGSVSDRLAVPVASAVAEQLEALKPTFQRRQVQRQRIRRAIDDRAFEMVFQPVFDLEPGAMVGVEALARCSRRTRSWRSTFRRRRRSPTACVTCSRARTPIGSCSR
jgi:sensor c-di-GMP phosphodiesterase-like protein